MSVVGPEDGGGGELPAEADALVAIESGAAGAGVVVLVDPAHDVGRGWAFDPADSGASGVGQAVLVEPAHRPGHVFGLADLLQGVDVLVGPQPAEGVGREADLVVGVGLLLGDLLVGLFLAEAGQVTQGGPVAGVVAVLGAVEQAPGDAARAAAPRHLLAALGGGFPLPPRGDAGLLVGLDGVGEQLHRGDPALALGFLAMRASDLVGELGEVVGHGGVLELADADVPAGGVAVGAGLPGGGVADSFQRGTPALEHGLAEPVGL